MPDRRNEPIVTSTMFSPAEQAAWRVAVDRGLPIEAADLRCLVEAAAPHIAAAEREVMRRAAADCQASIYNRDRDEWTPLADLMTDPDAAP